MSSATPLVSVIIPCWNQAHFLCDSVGSVKAQTCSNWEIIIVNDGSPDDTRDVSLALCQSDSRIRYIEQSNHGLSHARNRGIALARGDYLQFLDADDIILPSKLSRQVDLLASRSAERLIAFCDYAYGRRDDVGSGARSVFVSPEFITDNQCVELLCRWETDLSIPPHAFLFPRSLFNDLTLRFDERLPNHEDWDCWMRILYAGFRFVKADGVLAVYRTSSSSMSQQREAMRRGFEQAADQLMSLWHEDELLVGLLKRKKQKTHIAYGANRLYRSIELLVGQRWFRRVIPWPLQRRMTEFLRRSRELALPKHL